MAHLNLMHPGPLSAACALAGSDSALAQDVFLTYQIIITMLLLIERKCMNLFYGYVSNIFHNSTIFKYVYLSLL